MALSESALKTSLSNVGVPDSVKKIRDAHRTAATTLNAVSSIVPGVGTAIVAAQQAAISGAMTSLKAIGTKFAPNLLDLTGDIMTAVNTRVDSAINAIDDLCDGLDVPLPGGKAFSVNSCIALADEALSNPSLDIAETYLKDGLSDTLPGTIVAGATGALKNPYKTFGNWVVQTKYDAAGNAIRTAFKKGVPPLSPIIQCTPDTDFVKIPKELPDVLTINLPSRDIFDNPEGDFGSIA